MQKMLWSHSSFGTPSSEQIFQLQDGDSILLQNVPTPHGVITRQITVKSQILRNMFVCFSKSLNRLVTDLKVINVF